MQLFILHLSSQTVACQFKELIAKGDVLKFQRSSRLHGMYTVQTGLGLGFSQFSRTFFRSLFANANVIDTYAQETSNVNSIQGGALSYIFTTKRALMRKSRAEPSFVTPVDKHHHHKKRAFAQTSQGRGPLPFFLVQWSPFHVWYGWTMNWALFLSKPICSSSNCSTYLQCVALIGSDLQTAVLWVGAELEALLVIGGNNSLNIVQCV